VEKFTPVPSGTEAPLSVTTASTSVHVPAFGLASDVKSWTDIALDPPPPPTGFGAVGASAAQA